MVFKKEKRRLKILGYIKKTIRKSLNSIISYIYYRIYRNQTELNCSLCGNKIIRYLPLSKFWENETQKYGYKYFDTGEMTSLYTYSCPSCGSTDRERLYIHWLKNYFQKNNNFISKQKLIHFAPEWNLSKYLKTEEIFEYYTADLFMENVDFKADLMNLPFKDEEYDFIICSHVLEHVEDDRLVVSELHRILRKGGLGILMAPICLKIEETYEDASILLPEDRWKHFGQDDHVRLYSHKGFVEVLKSSGFKVNQLDIDYFTKEVFNSLGLKNTSILYVVEK